VPLLIGEILSRAAAVTPERVAATLGSEAITFREADRRGNAAANALAGLGVQRGDRVVSWTKIALTEIDICFGCARLGAVYVPLNPAYTLGEAATVVEYAKPRILLSDVGHQEEAAVIAKDSGLQLSVTGSVETTLAGKSFENLLRSSDDESVVGPGPSENDPHVIFLTSGSTGRPKGVEISHRASWIRHFSGATLNLTAGSEGGEVCTFPLFHMAGWLMTLLSWSANRSVHLVAQADPELLIREISTHRASIMYSIPAVWKRVIECNSKEDTSSLVWALTGTSRVSPEFIGELKERFPGTATTLAYGSSEAGSSARLGDGDLLRKPFSVGLPAPGVEARLDDGELLLRTDMLMSGYFDMPEETNEVLVDGWYHTGDLAEIDDDGYISIVGRRAETIRSGGEYIAPVEVESALAGFPGITEVAVIGMPDDVWGEIVTAVVAVKEGHEAPTVDALRAHVSDSLAPFKHPRSVVVIDKLPRTAATGQIQRRKVRQGLQQVADSQSKPR
jgi:acyl-CoA synthetase (AMP-forming)/AMP-acid ligase II